MGQVLWLILAVAVGATLGTVFHPGILEIFIVAFVLAACAMGYRSLSRRSHRPSGCTID